MERESPRPENEAAPAAPPAETNKAPRRRRGFAAMSPETVRDIARLGGRAAHQSGRAHEFSHDEAVAAGRKGGSAPHRSRGKRVPEAQEGG